MTRIEALVQLFGNESKNATQEAADAINSPIVLTDKEIESLPEDLVRSIDEFIADPRMYLLGVDWSKHLLFKKFLPPAKAEETSEKVVAPAKEPKVAVSPAPKKMSANEIHTRVTNRSRVKKPVVILEPVKVEEPKVLESVSVADAAVDKPIEVESIPKPDVEPTTIPVELVPVSKPAETLIELVSQLEVRCKDTTAKLREYYEAWKIQNAKIIELKATIAGLESQLKMSTGNAVPQKSDRRAAKTLSPVTISLISTEKWKQYRSDVEEAFRAVHDIDFFLKRKQGSWSLDQWEEYMHQYANGQRGEEFELFGQYMLELIKDLKKNPCVDDVTYKFKYVEGVVYET